MNHHKPGKGEEETQPRQGRRPPRLLQVHQDVNVGEQAGEKAQHAEDVAVAVGDDVRGGYFDRMNEFDEGEEILDGLTVGSARRL